MRKLPFGSAMKPPKIMCCAPSSLPTLHGGLAIDLAAADELLLVDELLHLVALDDADVRVGRHLGDEEVGDTLAQAVVVARVLA